MNRTGYLHVDQFADDADEFDAGVEIFLGLAILALGLRFGMEHIDGIFSLMDDQVMGRTV